MDAQLPWGWWRSYDGSAEALARVLADWMEEHGQPVWAAWFRDGSAARGDAAALSAQLDRFFGRADEPGPASMSLRVMVGSIPVSIPATRLDGPWFRAVHVLLDGAPEVPPLAELVEVPCMARLDELVVHSAALEGPLVGHVASPGLTCAHLAPLAGTLRGLWVLDGLAHGVGLASLTALEWLSTPLGPGEWRHPTVRALYTQGSEDFGRVELPAVRHVDVEAGTGGIAGLLAQLPGLETLEIEADHHEDVARALRDRRLPNLREVAIWGRSPELDGVRILRQSPLSRADIRVTSPWVFDRALRIAV
ncbi:MAG: hypothetical protein R3F61_20850 [Myxococcota bacterium]